MPSIDQITDLLNRFGPSVSSDLLRRLEASGIEPAAARKRISRAKGDVQQLSDVSFKNNQQFYYLKNQFGTRVFQAALVKAFQDTGSEYGDAIDGLDARSGIAPADLFKTFSGSPSSLARHHSYEDVLSVLKKYRLILSDNNPTLGELIVLNIEGMEAAQPQFIKACLLAERILMDSLGDWLRKNGMVSFNKLVLRNSGAPEFGHFNWDFCGPSYLRPLTSQVDKRLIAGFVVGDVVLGRELSKNHVSYFIRKCNILLNLRKTRPFLPLLIADSFSKDALQLGKECGFIFTTPSNLFGDDLGEGLRNLIQVLGQAAATMIANPEVVETIFKKLATIEGAASNIRGPLFEHIVGYCIKLGFGGNYTIGRQASNSKGNSTDIDVFLNKNNATIHCFECKGHGPNIEVSVSEVQKWTNTSIPIIRDWLLSQEAYRSSEVNFHFWTSGKFSADAQQHLNTVRSKTKKYSIDWKSGVEVRSYIKDLHEESILRVFDEQYCNHPLSNVLR